MRRICLLLTLALALMAPGWAATTYLKVENMAKTTLSAQLTGGALAIGVTDGSVFPSSGQFLVVVYQDMDTAFEVILCDSVSGNAITVNASGRGQEGTADATWPAGSFVVQTWTKGQIEDVWGAINGIEDGTTELAQVTLGDDNLVVFGDDDDYTFGWDGSRLEAIDADDNVHLELSDGGGTGTLRVNNAVFAGASDNTQGSLRAFGASSTQGGRLQLDNDAANDSTINIWYLVPVGGDLEFRRDGTAYLTVDDATGDITFENDLVQASTSRNKMRSFYVPAAEMTGTAGAGTYSFGDFAAATQEFSDGAENTAVFTVALPDYSGDDLEVTFVWGASASSGNVEWNVYVHSVTDLGTPLSTTTHELIDAAPGAAAVAAASVTVTPDSAADSDKVLFFKVWRDGDDGTNDTMTATAELAGVLIHY